MRGEVRRRERLVVHRKLIDATDQAADEHRHPGGDSLDPGFEDRTLTGGTVDIEVVPVAVNERDMDEAIERKRATLERVEIVLALLPRLAERLARPIAPGLPNVTFDGG